MPALKSVLCKKFKLGKSIKCRSGWIWQFQDLKKIIKVTQDPLDPNIGYKFDTVLSYLQNKNSPAVVKIYEYGSVDIEDQPTYYYHVMEKLHPLVMDGRDFAEKIIREYYNHRDYDPWFASAEIQYFLLQIKKLKYTYNDLHCDNIMLDCSNRLKLIDLESFLEVGDN